MIKIADGNLILHNVPMPEISYADSSLTLELDDEDFRRKTVKLRFSGEVKDDGACGNCGGSAG